MKHLIQRLTGVDPNRIGSNKLTSYLPYRKDAKEFDYKSVGGTVLSWLMGKHVKRHLTLYNFEATCIEYLGEKLSDTAVLDDLRQMYFSGDYLLMAAPEFMLLRDQSKANTSTKHLIDVLKSFFGKNQTAVKFESGTNFIEKGFLSLLKSELEDHPVKATEVCYLPFVADNFLNDIVFLTRHSEYFLEQLPSFIELYNFIYCSQLGLNIRNWTSGTPPSSKPLYFILDTEKASSERTHVDKEGYRSLAGPMADVFPILSMLEYFNADSEHPKVPLWTYANVINEASESDQTRIKESIERFAEEFRKDRELPVERATSIGAIESLRVLFRYGVKQFAKSVNQNRYDMQQNYMKVFHEQVATNFLHSRGRAGRVLVINQDFVLLLTNLAIRDRPSVRFQELCVAFEMRGFYFDKASKQALLKFYERVGNVDRMSDSGDAVYVRSTI